MGAADWCSSPEILFAFSIEASVYLIHIIGGRGGGGEIRIGGRGGETNRFGFNVAHKSRPYHLLKIAKQLFSKINVRRNEKIMFYEPYMYTC